MCPLKKRVGNHLLYATFTVTHIAKVLLAFEIATNNVDGWLAARKTSFEGFRNTLEATPDVFHGEDSDVCHPYLLAAIGFG